MRQLYDFNEQVPRSEYAPNSSKNKNEHPEEWAGYTVRLSLTLAYIISFLCLLRYDEMLGIKWTDVFFEDHPTKGPRIRLEMACRKTHQLGSKYHLFRCLRGRVRTTPLTIGPFCIDIAPFYLYPNWAKPYLCPVRAFAKWWEASGKGHDIGGGYVMRKKMGKDGWSDNQMEPMVCTVYPSIGIERAH